jgi:hypothetical protein
VYLDGEHHDIRAVLDAWCLMSVLRKACSCQQMIRWHQLVVGGWFYNVVCSLLLGSEILERMARILQLREIMFDKRVTTTSTIYNTSHVMEFKESSTSGMSPKLANLCS